MNPTIPARVQTRNRADRRLQSMTLGAAVLGIAATGAFGYAAALTFTGNTSAANAAGPQTGFGDDQPLQQPVNGGTGSSGQTGRNGAGTTVTPLLGGQQVTPPTTTRHRQSHVSSGGS